MVGPDMTTFMAKKGLNRTTLFGQMCLFGLVIFFSVSARLFNAMFFHGYPYQYCTCAASFRSSLGIGLDKK